MHRIRIIIWSANPQAKIKSFRWNMKSKILVRQEKEGKKERMRKNCDKNEFTHSIYLTWTKTSYIPKFCSSLANGKPVRTETTKWWTEYSHILHSFCSYRTCFISYCCIFSLSFSLFRWRFFSRMKNRQKMQHIFYGVLDAIWRLFHLLCQKKISLSA